MAKYKETAIVLSQEQLSEDIFSMWIQTSHIAKEAICGQFVSIYTKDGAKLLPRPISLCEIEADRIRIVYRVVGAGTKEFSAYQAGDPIEIMGPLGNGFPLKEKKAFLIGGGIGIPPMLQLAKSLNCEKQMVLGYRDAQLFLKKEFEPYGTVYVATEDGSVFIGWYDATTGEFLGPEEEVYKVRGNGAKFSAIYADLAIGNVKTSPYSTLPRNTQVTLSFTVENTGDEDMDNLTVKIESSDASLSVLTDELYFRRLPAGCTGSVSTKVVYTGSESSRSIPLTITVTDENNNSWTESFSLTSK